MLRCSLSVIGSVAGIASVFFGYHRVSYSVILVSNFVYASAGV